MPVEALDQRPPLVDQVYERLVGAIADGRLPPGGRLRQEAVAEMLGVSRQPVSHALALLKNVGLVIDHGRRGLMVAPVDPERLRDLYEVRTVLDGLAARQAALRVQGGAIDAANRLSRIVAAGRETVVVGEMAAMVDADVSFHQAVNGLAGNAVLEEMADTQWPHVRRTMAAVLDGPGGASLVWDEHAAIADAILAGDPDAAEAAATAHARRAGEQTYRRLTDSAGLDAGAEEQTPTKGARP